MFSLKSIFKVNIKHSINKYAFTTTTPIKVPMSILKTLRERTGIPLTDCKVALEQSNLDIEKALDYLRKKGASVTLKSAGRTATQGLISVSISKDNKTGVIVELNSETDFVALNERFQTTLKDITDLVLNNLSKISSTTDVNGSQLLNIDEIKKLPMKDSTSVQDTLDLLVSAIRENILLRRVSVVSVKDGVVGKYVHNVAKDDLGRVCCLVSLSSASNNANLVKIADTVAMNTVALKPSYLNRKSVPSEISQREMDIHKEQLKSSGKKENIIENIIKAKMNKFYEEIVLDEQNNILSEDPKSVVKISKWVENEGALIGAKDLVYF